MSTSTYWEARQRLQDQAEARQAATPRKPKPVAKRPTVGVPTTILAAWLWPITWFLLCFYNDKDHPRVQSLAYMIGGDGKMYGDPAIVGYPDARIDERRAAIRAVIRDQEEEARRRALQGHS